MNTFAEVKKTLGTESNGRGCAVCGAKNTGAMQVALFAMQSGSRPDRVASRMRSFCETHAVELFTELLAELEKRAGKDAT